MAQYSGIWNLTQAGIGVATQNWTGITPPVIEYLLVAGGGGGGSRYGGGGGAGGLLAGLTAINKGTTAYVTVGAGGNGNTCTGLVQNGTAGTNSVLLATSCGASTGTFIAFGGGQGDGNACKSFGGGSGGGASYRGPPSASVTGQGNPGGGMRCTCGFFTGGGGGAGTAGGDFNGNAGYAGNGGQGAASSISGSSVVYAGGGGGATVGSGRPRFGIGGAGGGGTGAACTAGSAGSQNTGGGGGGGSGSYGGYNGGSGIVILRYPSQYKLAVNVVTGTYSTCSTGAYRIYTFNSSGSITF